MTNVNQIEGILFISGDEGTSLEEISALTGFAIPAIRDIIQQLTTKYQLDDDSALQIVSTGKKYKLTTKRELAGTLKKYFELPAQTTLSNAALEILAIVGYHQPITRIEIDEIRGVNSGSTLQNLVARGLIEASGRLNAPGRPKMYSTTEQFLDYFGIEKITDLPELPSEEKLQDTSEGGDLFLKEFNQKINLKDT